MPESTVLPVLVYPTVRDAVKRLSDAFGFVERWEAKGHRAQLVVGDGVVVVVDGDMQGGCGAHSVMVRVADVDSHYARALEWGARILTPPADYPYGERQYTAEDYAGHRWTFSQSIADVLPEDWGGTSGPGMHG
ncbi:MAG TPA: VOC family protein [Gaiellaceae bacterium]|nr:VOC family protein [Gaiellaceae bacterium]